MSKHKGKGSRAASSLQVLNSKIDRSQFPLKAQVDESESIMAKQGVSRDAAMVISANRQIARQGSRPERGTFGPSGRIEDLTPIRITKKTREKIREIDSAKSSAKKTGRKAQIIRGNQTRSRGKTSIRTKVRIGATVAGGLAGALKATVRAKLKRRKKDS